MTVQSSNSPVDPLAPRKSDKYIPWYFVGGFAVMLIANICLITFSQTSWVGLVTQHAFDEGNNYNAALAGAAREKALGWRSKLQVNGVINNSATVTVLFRDAQSKPLSGAKVEVAISRFDRDDMDRKFMLNEVDPGQYRANIPFPIYGRWQIRTVAEVDKDNYQSVDVVVVQP